MTTTAGSARRISVLAMGGTISTEPGAQGAEPARGAARIAADVDPGAGLILKPRDVAKLASHKVGPADMWQLAEAVREEVAAGADGVVITHGTDTLEETAYALALLLDRSVPIVCTAAQRPPHLPGADGPANLSAAVVVAADPATAAYGPVVVHQDEVHVARWVTKQFGTRVAAFASPAAGPVGYVAEGRVHYLLGPAPGGDRLPRVAPPNRRVELFWAVAGADGLVVDAVVDRVDGLVLAGSGGGHAAPGLAAALVRVVQSGRPVVMATRCVGGGVLRDTYGGDGSERQLLGDGLVSSGLLPPLKARLRLLFGLSAGLDVEELFPTPTPVVDRTAGG